MKNTTHLHFTIFTLFLLLFYLTEYGDADGGIPGIKLLMPPSHVALSGDLHIQIASTSFPPLVLQLSRLEGNLAQPLTTLSVLPVASALAMNRTVVKIPCGFFSRGGQYYVLVKKQPIGPRNSSVTTDVNLESDPSMIIRILDVRWPLPKLSLTPEHLQTYPEQPVSAILEFPEVVCRPRGETITQAIPEFWLELHYCGHSLLGCGTTDIRNSSQILYSEQVRSIPTRKILTLRCELFGLAGHYALFLKPTTPIPGLSQTAAYIKADWSEKFVFNVHARSIFPCDVHNGGVIVLFQYPECILAGDRVRLFGNERANVASLAPPTSKKYIAEQRVERGKHSLHFDCDLFAERYVEYCFVYVSQAISGAVSEVREDCVPTLPVSDQDSGGWGPWSPWTPCSSTCIGGTRSRYRFCDSPPPRYGAKFCEGSAIETEKCATSLGSGWECLYTGAAAADLDAIESTEIQTEVGQYCRCGCVVHLGRAKPRRLLATNGQSCPGRNFWQLQAEPDYIIQFNLLQFRLPCGSQWLKIRDGDSLASNLLADIWDDSAPVSINSTGSQLLLEFFSKVDMEAVNGGLCGGGMMAQAQQISSPKTNLTTVSVAQSVGVVPAVVLKLTAVHIAAIFFLSGLLIATALLGVQYMFRYRTYHIAKAEDLDSLADPSGSNASLPVGVRTASSNATLLSEVISLTRLRPHVCGKNRHQRLRESMNCETKQGKNEHEVALANEEDSLSASSTTTLTPDKKPKTFEQEEKLPSTSCSLRSTPKMLRRSSTIASDKDKSNEKDEEERKREEHAGEKRRLSNVSNLTLTNGCYSSAASMVSTATIRSTNAKETKEKRNREKLLAGPTGSDFSIAAQDNDLEMDYYDYNVVNAGAAPGSYLGMDPAFLVWIPPLDETGEILPDDDDNRESHELEDIRPKVYIDPGSNKESPEQEMLLPKAAGQKLLNELPPSRCSPILKAKNKRVHPLAPEMDNKYKAEIEPLVHQNTTKVKTTIQLHEYPKNKLKRKDMEKETEVEKSPSLDGGGGGGGGGGDYLDNIKFADDEEEDLTENQCNKEVSYHDSNILSSS